MKTSGGWRAGALAALCCATAAAGVAWWRTSTLPPALPTEVRLDPSVATRPMTGMAESTVAITADGRAIVYSAERVDPDGVARDLLVLRRLDTGADHTLVTAPGGAEARSPFFSDDGQWVGFHDRGRLMKVSVQGGQPLELCACGASAAGGALWLRDGGIVYHTGGRLRLLHPDGSGRDLTRRNTIAGERDHLAPASLPDQDTIMFTVVNRDGTSAVRTVNLRTGRERVLIAAGMFARYAGNGHLLYVDGDSEIHVADLDLDGLRVYGDARVDRLVHASSRGGTSFAVSQTGTLVYSPAVDVAANGLVLAWVTRDGRQQPTGVPPGPYAVARISPAGDQVALEVRHTDFTIWLWNLATNALTRQTRGPRDAFPTWMPDGRSLLVHASHGNSSSIDRIWLDGSGRVTQLPAPVQLTGIYDVSPDGRRGVFRSERPGVRLRLMSTDGGPVSTLTEGPGRQTAAALSPDGRWMVFDASPRGGRGALQEAEVFVQPFPATTPARQQISVGGGSRPLWSRDGREIIYVDRKNHLMRVEVSGTDRPVFGAPTPLFTDPSVTADWYFGLGRRSFDLTADGSRFLVISSSVASVPRQPSSVIVVSDWLRHPHRPWTGLVQALRRRAA